MTGPEIIRSTGLALQVCVPEEFTDEKAADFANSAEPTGITSRWHVVDPRTGDPRRVACAQRPGYVHLVMEC